MQNHALRTSQLLVSGVALAPAVTFVLGWFAAISLPAQTVRAISLSPVTAFLLFSIAMSALPALAIGFLAGAALGARGQHSKLTLVVFASLPWLLYATLGTALFYPGQPEVGFVQSLAPLRSWQVWLPIASVPVGLWLGATLPQRRTPGRSCGAASAA